MASRHHNCIQFVFAKEGAVPTSEVFGQTVLLGMLGFKTDDIFCLISLAHRFDVSLYSSERLAEFWVR